MHRTNPLATAAYLAVAGLALAGADAAADDTAAAQAVVDESTRTFTDMSKDPNMTWFRDNVDNARALMIVPNLGRAGFIIGGSGGRGLLLAKDSKSGQWTNPAFYTIGSASIGLQIGGELSEVILMVMTEKGLNAMLSTKAQLGGDMSVAAGPVGAGAKAATTDVLAFARSKGAYGGLSVEGSVITPDDKRNSAYYGKSVTPTDILVRRSVNNPRAGDLVKTVAKGSKN